MEYIILSIRTASTIGMKAKGVAEEILVQLSQLEEDQFIACFHQQVEKDRQKAWHDHHVKEKHFHHIDTVLLYDNRFAKHLEKVANALVRSLCYSLHY